MAPKNKKRNSFYFFMKDLQDKEARRGCRITLMDLPNIAHPIWAKMSLVEREPYEEIARQHKNDPTLRGGKLASDGTRVEDNLRELQNKEKCENQMKQAVKKYCNVDCISEEQFKEFASRKLFYFISFNILCQTETEYLPNEIGLVEYSIRNGIHREYHTLIYPGYIPTGYTGEAKRLCEVHEIDIFGEKGESERDLKKVYKEIKNFTNPDNSEEYPPLFCMEENMNLNQGCLNYLSDHARENCCFEVWNAVYLLLELRAGVDEPLPSIILASDLLTKPSFNYHSTASCEFHEEKDNHNCALAYSKRLCYLLSDATCEQFDVELTERHIPAISSEEKSYTVISSFNAPRNKDKFEPPLRLDSRSSYYPSTETEEDTYSDIKSAVSSSVASGHRQPASTCLAAEMARLRLNMTSATVPGHGIGRGQRR